MKARLIKARKMTMSSGYYFPSDPVCLKRHIIPTQMVSIVDYILIISISYK